MLTRLRLPALCLKCSWHFPWVSANPVSHRMGSERRNRAPARGREEVAPLRGSPWSAHTAGGNRSGGTGGAVRARRGCPSAFPGGAKRRFQTGRRVCVCGQTWEGGWGLAFSGSKPRDSAAPVVLGKVQAWGAFGIRRVCVWNTPLTEFIQEVLIECSMRTRWHYGHSSYVAGHTGDCFYL